MLISTLFLLAATTPGSQTGITLPKTKVTFESGAMPSGRLLPLLGKSADVSLITGPGMDRDILVLSVKDAPLDEVMQRIAKVQLGRWQIRQDGSFELMADLAAREAQKEQLFANRTAELKKALEPYYSSLAKRPKFDAAAAKEYMGGGEEDAAPANPPATKTPSKEPPLPQLSPGYRAILRMMRSIPLRQIAALEDGSRIVFSTQPNRFQKALGPDAAGALANLLVDQRALVQEAKRAGSAPSKADTSQPLGEQHSDWDSDWTPEDISEPPYKALLIITRRRTTATAELICYSQAGRELFSESLFINAGRAQHPPEDSVDKPQKDASREITLGEETKAIGRFLQSFQEDPTSFKSLPSAVLDKLSKPTEFDPLFAIADVAKALAAADGLQLVGNLADDSSILQRLMAKDKLTTNLARTLLQRSSTLDQSAGWLLLSPQDYSLSAATRLDRQSLQNLIEACSRTVIPSIDDTARFALANPRMDGQSFAILYFMLFVPNSFALISGAQGELWPALRFYGSLGDSQKRTLLSSGKLTYGSLQPGQLSILQEAVMNDELTIQIPRSEQTQDKEPEGFSPFGNLFGGTQQSGETPDDFRSEPTELLPNGLPMDGFVEAQSNTGQGVLIGEQGGAMSRFLGIINPSELAFLKAASDMYPQDMGENFFPKPTAMRLGERTDLQLKFWLTPGAFTEAGLRGGRLLSDTKLYELDTLPGNMRSLYKAAYEKAKAEAEKERAEPGHGGESEGNPP